MTHQEKIEWMAVWAVKHHVRLDLEGECGIGRECVGIIADPSGYPEYEWDDEQYNRIDNNGDVWSPADAYHKHPCVAVLGRGEQAESQLYDWLKWFDENGFVVEKGDNRPEEWMPLGQIGILMGKHRYARMVKKQEVSAPPVNG